MTRSSSFTKKRRVLRRAFTLSELLIASSVFVVMVALLCGVVVAQTKCGVSLGNYADMNESSRRLFTQFDKDMRMAKDVSVMGAQEVKADLIEDVDWNALLGSADASTWAKATSGKTATTRYIISDSKLVREYTSDGKTSSSTLLSGLLSGSFVYFNNDDDIATTTPSIKKIMVSGVMQRPVAQNKNTDYLVSAVVVLRSKPGTRSF